MMMKDPILNGVLEALKQVQPLVLEETKRFNEVILSPRYKVLSEEIEALSAEREEMTQGLTAHRDQMKGLQTTLRGLMNELHVLELEGCEVRTKVRKGVNQAKLLEKLGGDIDNYMTLASVTQIALQNYAKENPLLKKDLLDCIEVTGEEVAEVELLLPSQP